ncbi:uncharacterized protein [Garra rufa]|uniref:uncharacterized protein n=1 Tax=Garra rufa TaxID=137080 RepID=UPI003CCE9F41
MRNKDKCVFGVDADEVKSVSVMEGDSVTLNNDLTEIQGSYQILWWFNGSVIDETGEIFRDRLELNQTGSLIIKNMRTKHTGAYELQIDLSTGLLKKIFSVTVFESQSVATVTDAGEAEMKSVSVMKGDSVTLQTDVTKINGSELIVWRFGEEGKLIAKCDIEAKSPPLYYDERFRERLKLDHQTGSLIITNTRTTDSGLYTVKISSNKQTLHKRFTVNVIGLSPGAKAGISVAVVLLLMAAAAFVFYYRQRIWNLKCLMEPENSEQQLKESKCNS